MYAVCGGGAEQKQARLYFFQFISALPNRSVPSIRGPSPPSCILARIISSSVNSSNLGFSPSPTPPRSLPIFPPSPRPNLPSPSFLILYLVHASSPPSNRVPLQPSLPCGERPL
jgi:hypothetical protein